MKVPRLLASLSMALTLAATLVPTTNTFADNSVPSWGDPSQTYGTQYRQLYGDLTDSGLGNPDYRPAILDRWQAVFTNQVTQQVATLGQYDVFDIQKQYDTDNFATKSGYGLLPLAAKDKIQEFVKDYANGNPDYVWNIVQGWTDPSKDDGAYLLNYQPYIRMSRLVELSGGGFDRMEASPTQPYDPGGINGTAYFRVSPWPKINTAAIQGDTIHIAYTTYGYNWMHHPQAHLSNGIDSITQDIGLVSQPQYDGTWDIPVSQVTQKLGPLDKLSVIVEDGYGRTATAPLKPGAVMTYHWMADYTVPYTAGQPASFTQPLTLTLDQVPATIDPKQLSDTFSWSYSVDGSGWQPLTVLPDVAKVFDASGKLKQKIVIDTNTLNTVPGRQWGGGAHQIRIKVSAVPGDAGKYLFTSQDSGGPGSEAVVTVTFTEAGQITTPIQTQMGNGLLTIMWPNSHPDPSSPTGRAMGGLPDQVSPCGTFVAPIEISNDSNVTINTTVDFVIDGTIVIKRTFESQDDSPPPPPQYMSFPLHGVATKTFTIPPKMHVYWDVGFGEDRNVTYTIEGYEGPTVGPNYHDEVLCSFIRLPETTEEGPIGPLVGPLDVGMPATRSANSYDPVPNYAVHIQAIPRDPEDYVHSPIDEWIGVTQSMPHSRVHLVQ